jgi:phosphoserine phosphatase RsbU/P
MAASLIADLAFAAPAIPAELNGVRFSTAQNPGCEVSGDFVVIARREHQICVVIGDACGRGAPAASVVSRVRPHLVELASFAETPAELLGAVNRAVAGELPDDLFVTAAALIVDTETGWARSANAGHVPPMLRRGRTTRLLGTASGPPLGMVARAAYRNDDCQILPGDIILMMTDGIVEAVEDDLMIMPRLQSLLGGAPHDLDEITRAIFAEVLLRANRVDDRTLVGFELTRRLATPASFVDLPAQAA